MMQLSLMLLEILQLCLLLWLILGIRLHYIFVQK